MRWLVVALLLVLGALLPKAAVAQTAPADRAAASAQAAGSERADELVRVAGRARRLGRYGFAIQALKQAYKAKSRPQLLWVIGDAYHQRFKAKRRAYDRVQALAYLQRYLATPAAAEEAAKAQAAKARAAVAELEAIEVPDDRRALEQAAAAERAVARVAVTSPALAAVARIDGGAAQKLPLLTAIAAGEHTIEVSAAGREPEQRKLLAVAGYVAIVDVTLKPEAAKLSVRTSNGARVHVDGRFVGVAPFEEPLSVEPGKRSLLVAMNGHRPVRRRLTLERGKTREVEIDLPVTKRRIGASFVIAFGAASVTAGVISGAIAIISDNVLQDDPGDSALLSRRDTARGISAMTAGIGFGLSLSGGIMWVFDEPTVTLSPQGPGQLGATLTTRF